MKVKELIERLKECRQDDEIVISVVDENDDYASHAIDGIEEHVIDITELIIGEVLSN